MKQVCGHIFKKNAILLALCLFLLCGTKFYALYVDGDMKEYPFYDEEMDNIFREANTLSWEEVLEFEEILYDRLDAYLGAGNFSDQEIQEISSEFSRRISSFMTYRRNYFQAKNVLDFAKTGEGILDPTLLYLMDYLYVYEEMDYPQMINTDYFSRFFILQEKNVVFLILTIMTAILWGSIYERRMDHVTWITKKGRGYVRNLHFLMGALFLGIVLVSDLFDLIASGVLSHTEYLSVTAQSLANTWPEFRVLPMDITIGELLFLQMGMRILGLVILYFLIVVIAQRVRDMKTSLMIAGVLILFCYFLNNSTGYSGSAVFFPVGYINIAQKTSYSGFLLKMQMSPVVLSLIISIIIGGILLGHRIWREHRVPQ